MLPFGNTVFPADKAFAAVFYARYTGIGLRFFFRFTDLCVRRRSLRINVLIIVMHRKTNNKYNFFMIMIIRRYCVLPAYAVRKKRGIRNS